MVSDTAQAAVSGALEKTASGKASVFSKEDALDILFINFSEPLILLDLDYHFLLINDAAKKAFNIVSSSIKSNSFLELIDQGQFSGRIICQLEKCAGGNLSYFQEEVKNNETVSKKWEIRLEPFTDDSGEVRAILLAGREFSFPQEANEKLKLYHDIFSSTSEMIVMIDDELRCLVANYSFCHNAMLGSQQIINKRIDRLLEDCLSPQMLRKHIKHCLKGNNVNFQTWFALPCNKQIFLDVSLIPQFNDSGALQGAILTARDITDLWKAKTKYKLVLDSSQDGFWELNIKSPKFGLILTDKSRKMFELPISENKIIDSLDKIPRLNAKAKEKLATEFKQFLKSENQKKIFHSEIGIEDGYGKIRYIQFRGKVVLRDKNGKPKSLIGIQTDVSNLRKGKEELKRAKGSVVKANQVKSEFLANMSHEIRTPLNSVINNTDLLNKTPLTPIQQDFLSSIKVSGETLLNLITDILDLSKIEAGMMQIKLAPSNISQVIHEISKIFKIRCIEKGIGLSIALQQYFPSKIIIDEIRVRQVLVNLIGNAIKFTQKGEVNVKLNYRKYWRAKEAYIDLTIEVKDTGIGIKQSEQENIFKAFHQQTGQSTRKYGGTGLGLSITKRLVEMMHGSIKVKSKWHSGSTFTVFVPAVKIHDQAKLLENRRVSLKRGKEPSPIAKFCFEEKEKATFNFVQHIFNQTCLLPWKKAIETELSEDIMHFNEQLAMFAENYGFKNLLRYSRLLQSHLESFSVNKMIQLLQDFEKIIKINDRK